MSNYHETKLPKETKPVIEAKMLRKRYEMGVATLAELKKLRILEKKGY